MEVQTSMSFGALAAGAVITIEFTSAGWRLKKENTISCGKATTPGFQGRSTRPSTSRLPLYPGPYSAVMLSMMPPASDAAILFFCGMKGGMTSAMTGAAGAEGGGG